jgi:hypothetical protein
MHRWWRLMFIVFLVHCVLFQHLSLSMTFSLLVKKYQQIKKHIIPLRQNVTFWFILTSFVVIFLFTGLHTVPEGIVYSFWVLAAILLVGCLLLLIVVIRFRKASVLSLSRSLVSTKFFFYCSWLDFSFEKKQDFRQSSPLLSCVMIVGAIIAIPSLYFFGTRLNVFYCHLRVWLIFVGYDLFLG